ncbi:helix-turn-helix transcriptional regulator [Bacillus nakamurai]|nr:helix-turn-helix transcriptional regulator [Bacillus nakamurai]MED1228324.1 helix-turn-helix transcriptional regulator [Bacillus nakamurai]
MKQWKPISPRLNELMFEYNVSIDDLVNRTGYPRQRINDYVSGVKANMNLATGMTFADAIGCSIEELYEWNHKERRIVKS